MIRQVSVIALMLVLLYAAGCVDPQRVTQLEKQNQELQEKLKAQEAAVDYDLSSRCSQEAKRFFNENWRSDRDTILLDYSAHRSKRYNSCFVLIEWHYAGGGYQVSWVNHMSLLDVHDNVRHGEFSQAHLQITHANYKDGDPKPYICMVDGQKCETLEQFNQGVRGYMND